MQGTGFPVFRLVHPTGRKKLCAGSGYTVAADEFALFHFLKIRTVAIERRINAAFAAAVPVHVIVVVPNMGDTALNIV